MFRKIMMAIAALTLLAGIPSAGWSASAKDSAASVVATVNGITITRQDFDREMETAKKYFAHEGHDAKDKAQEQERRQAVLDKLVNGAILYDASVKEGIKVDPAAVDAEFNAYKARFHAEKEFQDALAKLSFDEAGIKEKIGQSLAIEQFINEKFVGKAKVAEQEIKDYYDNNVSAFASPEQVRASHILITVKPDADEATKKEAHKKLERIRKKIIAGGDFAAFAKKNSECPSSAKGGDLGYFSRGQMVKPFENTVFAMMPGDVSDIVETQFGYHLIKLTDKKHASTVSYDDAKERIKGYLQRNKSQQALVEYLKAKHETAKISTHLPAD